jgi:hypothetical protein
VPLDDLHWYIGADEVVGKAEAEHSTADDDDGVVPA